MKLEQRRSGKTLGGLIKFLGEVMLNPGKKISYRDHLEDEYTIDHRPLHVIFEETLKDLIEKLGLKEIEVTLSEKGRLECVSRWQGVYLGEDGSIFKKVS